MKKNSRQLPPLAAPSSDLGFTPPSARERTLPPRQAEAHGGSALIPIGRIAGTHGVRGELKLHPFNPDTEAIAAGMTIILRKGGVDQPRSIRTLRPHKRVLLITIDGCDSMTDAETLVGSDACIDEVDLPEMGPDEIYHYQLVGMEVVTVEGVELGRIVEVIETGANDVCTVRGRGREYMIPLIADVVKTVDKVQGRLVIDPLPGLFDL